MKISEFVVWLQAQQAKHGDLDVMWESATREWPVDPAVRERPAKHVVVNS